jgi:hypothetical protein
MEVAEYLVEILPKGHLVLVNYEGQANHARSRHPKQVFLKSNDHKTATMHAGDVLVVDPFSRVTVIEVHSNSNAIHVGSEVLVDAKKGRIPLFSSLARKQRLLQQLINSQWSNLRANIVSGLVVLPRLRNLRGYMLGPNAQKIAHGQNWRNQLKIYFMNAMTGSENPNWIDFIRRKFNLRIDKATHPSTFSANTTSAVREKPANLRTHPESSVVICYDVLSLRREIQGRIEILMHSRNNFYHPRNIMCITTQSALDTADRNTRLNAPIHDHLRMGDFLLTRKENQNQNHGPTQILMCSACEISGQLAPVVLLVYFSENESDALRKRGYDVACVEVFEFRLESVKPPSAVEKPVPNFITSTANEQNICQILDHLGMRFTDFRHKNGNLWLNHSDFDDGTLRALDKLGIKMHRGSQKHVTRFPGQIVFQATTWEQEGTRIASWVMLKPF